MVFPHPFNLSSLNGINGFTIEGITSNDRSGYSVSNAGDINADGIDDLIIGAYYTTPDGEDRAGTSYVVFGSKTSPGENLNLSNLDGMNGFAILDIARFSDYGRSVSSAGDVNGDGIDDLIIGADFASAVGKGAAGQSYIVFGGKNFGASLDPSSLNGKNGFVVNGIDENDLSGSSVSGAGDVNGDGLNDLIIGAYSASPNGKERAGQSYVVFGSKTIGSASLSLSELDGTNGFVIDGIDENDRLGYAVSSAGDVNADGIDDLIISTKEATLDSNPNSGESYVVFGSKTSRKSLELSDLDGTNGFVIDGIDRNSFYGESVSSAGDINGDGIDDLIIGANYSDLDGDGSGGESYVVFGSKTSPGARLNVFSLNGTNGFVIEGNGRSGISVSSAGDVDGDGIDDLIVGADYAAPNGKSSAGASYVVFGSKTSPGKNLNLSDLDGKNGFVINGIDSGDRSGSSVSGAGDVNGDGIDDLIIGADYAAPNGNDRAGESYVVFGVPTDAQPVILENKPPAIITNNLVNTLENQTAVVDINSTDDSDTEKEGLIYAIHGGEDRTLFTVDRNFGQLKFITAPDFENPGDANGDNSYLVQIIVTDRGGLTSVKDFTVVVNDEAAKKAANTINIMSAEVNNLKTEISPKTIATVPIIAVMAIAVIYKRIRAI